MQALAGFPEPCCARTRTLNDRTGTRSRAVNRKEAHCEPFYVCALKAVQYRLVMVPWLEQLNISPTFRHTVREKHQRDTYNTAINETSTRA